jgi:hypothetical protein
MTGETSANPGHIRVHIEAGYGAEYRHHRLRELEHRRPPPGLKHAKDLSQTVLEIPRGYATRTRS